MQNCFREHPDIYGSELDEDEAPEGEALPSETSASSSGELESSSSAPASKGEKVGDEGAHPIEAQGKTERAQAAAKQVKADHEPTSESEEMVPKAWHDSK